MRSPFLILNTAIADRIELRTGREVHDDTPEKEVFPYIVMGAMHARDWSDKFTPGQEVNCTVHVWSEYKGKKEVAMICDEVLQAVTWKKLDLGSGFNAVVDSMDDHSIITDIDGVTRHGILDFRFLIEER